MAIAGLTDTGLLRPANQDYFQVEKKGSTILAVVCDGIGGNRAGDVASATACRSLAKSFETTFDISVDLQQWLIKAVNKANSAVYRKSAASEKYAGMGTTLVGFIAGKNGTYVVNVGDSRCYGVIDDKLVQITEDHTLVNDLIKHRGFPAEVANALVGKNVISKAVGVAEKTDCDVFEVSGYDALLLCSDGLHGYVSEDAIMAVMREKSTPASKCRKLIRLANEAGGFDNITAVIYQR